MDRKQPRQVRSSPRQQSLTHGDCRDSSISLMAAEADCGGPNLITQEKGNPGNASQSLVWRLLPGDFDDLALVGLRIAQGAEATEDPRGNYSEGTANLERSSQRQSIFDIL